jgi:hypothetical protein
MTGDHALSLNYALKYALKKMSRFVRNRLGFKKSMDQTQISSRWFRLLKLDLLWVITTFYWITVGARSTDAVITALFTRARTTFSAVMKSEKSNVR